MKPLREAVVGGIIIAACSVYASAQDAARSARVGVGATTRHFVPDGSYDWRGATTHALITTVWYPATARLPAQEHTIGPVSVPWFLLGRWADDAPRSDGRFPLIVVSHGTGGSAGMIGWLASGLAARGYIVAAVNHPGNNSLEPYTAEGFLLWWLRARDLTTVVDLLLRDKDLAPGIDRSRIGAIGFSLGGYTMFEIAGGRTDPARFLAFCRSANAEGCADPPEFPNLFSRWAELQTSSDVFRDATAQAGVSYRDDRIRAVFAIAPAAGPAFIPESLRQISAPVAVLAGAADSLVPVRSNAQALVRMTPKARLTLLNGGVDHYTFLAVCTDAGRREQPQLCGDAPGVDREAIHQQTIDKAVRFFAATLK